MTKIPPPDPLSGTAQQFFFDFVPKPDAVLSDGGDMQQQVSFQLTASFTIFHRYPQPIVLLPTICGNSAVEFLSTTIQSLTVTVSLPTA